MSTYSLSYSIHYTSHQYYITHTHTHTHTHMVVHTHTHTHTHKLELGARARTHTHTHTHTQIRAGRYTQILKTVRVYMYTMHTQCL